MSKDPNQPPSEEKERQYQSIFDSASDGLIITDLDIGLVLEANPAACLMHGYTREELIGLQLTDFIHPESQQGFSEYLRAFQADGVFDPRTQHVCRDGSTFYAEWRGTAFIYQGRSCLLGIVRDVSKRIQTEQNLHQRAETRTHEQATFLQISIPCIHLEFHQLDPPPISRFLSNTQVDYFIGGSTLHRPGHARDAAMEHSPHFLIQLQDPQALTALFNSIGFRIADCGVTARMHSLRSLLTMGLLGLEVMHRGLGATVRMGRIIGGVGSLIPGRIISQLTMPTWP